MHILKIFSCVLVLFISQGTTQVANAFSTGDLSCSIVSVGQTSPGCTMRHERGLGNLFHTGHRWTSTTGGRFSPAFTVVSETTNFMCNCNVWMTVRVRVNFSLLLIGNNNSTELVVCPPSNSPVFPV